MPDLLNNKTVSSQLLEQLPLDLPWHLLDKKNTRIAVAMSGGVDSSMVAWLLKQAGFENLIGFTAWTLNGPGKCCNDALINAGRVCEVLDFPYDTVDLRGKFSHFVMDYYEKSYEEGLTPNPCVECNRYVKWQALVEYARDVLKADFVATGHYTRIIHDENNIPHVYCGEDKNKDQSYMLAQVRPEDLKYTLFPLGLLQKPQLVDVAKQVGIPTAHSKESQDVCFVLNGQANYLTNLLGIKTGNIIDIETNNIVGTHDGYYLFTLGQRKGLGVAMGVPVYVVKIDKENNTVYVGDKKYLAQDKLTVVDVNWIQVPAQSEFKAMVKYRYNSPPIEGLCTVMNNSTIEVTLNEPAFGLSRGQIAAFYDLEFKELWGGGYIESHLQHKPYDPDLAVLPSWDEACQIFK